MEEELQSLGFQIIAFSPDRPSELVESLKVKDLGYGLYSDARMEASRAMGIAYRLGATERTAFKFFGVDLEQASGETHHELPVPSVFLVDKGGRILWVYSNPDYTVRPDNDRLLQAARAVQMTKLE